MPLLPGKADIGHNVKEMEAHGHSKKQAVAAALHTALDEGDMLKDVPGQWKGKAIDPEAARNSAEMAGGKADWGGTDSGDGEEGTINSRLTGQAQRKGAIMSHDGPEVHSTTAMTHADINKKNAEYHGNIGPAESEAAAPMLAGTRVGPVPVWHPEGGTGDEADSTSEQRQERKAANPNKVAQQRGPLTRSVIAQGTKMTGPWHGKTGRESLQKEAKETNHWENESLDGVGDEVSPTQSDPPDTRSDNLLERPHGGIPGTESLLSGDGLREAVRAGAEAGERVAGAHDDLEEGSESMAHDESEPAEATTMSGRKVHVSVSTHKGESSVKLADPSGAGHTTTTFNSPKSKSEAARFMHKHLQAVPYGPKS